MRGVTTERACHDWSVVDFCLSPVSRTKKKEKKKLTPSPFTCRAVVGFELFVSTLISGRCDTVLLLTVCFSSLVTSWGSAATTMVHHSIELWRTHKTYHTMFHTSRVRLVERNESSSALIDVYLSEKKKIQRENLIHVQYFYEV